MVHRLTDSFGTPHRHLTSRDAARCTAILLRSVVLVILSQKPRYTSYSFRRREQHPLPSAIIHVPQHTGEGSPSMLCVPCRIQFLHGAMEFHGCEAP